MQDIDIKGLVDVCKALLAKGGRHVIAIAGAPGSGKSTLVEALAAAINAGDAVAILPMDGFHYDDGVLEAMGRRPWKGAPDTFDVGGLKSTLDRLLLDRGPVAVPVFDRTLEISRGSARIIGSEARLVLAEGNYLLLDRAPWSDLAGCYDATVLIDVPEDELARRLRKRWVGYDLTDDQITFKLEQNDLPNGRVVISESRAADYRLRAG